MHIKQFDFETLFRLIYSVEFDGMFFFHIMVHWPLQGPYNASSRYDIECRYLKDHNRIFVRR